MPTNLPIQIVAGFSESQRSVAAALFWQAFAAKLGSVMKPEALALQFLTRVVSPSHALSAITPDGNLVGIAGYKTDAGAFVGGGMRDLMSVYGSIGGIWRGALLSLLERETRPDELLMDGIFVDSGFQGQGIGAALLAAIKDKARATGCSRVRLDVINTNPRARALYERSGFVAQATTSIGPFRYLFRFEHATEMVWTATDIASTTGNAS